MSPLRGRFRGPTGEDMRRFSSSLDTDLRMVEEELDACAAHAAMLGECGILADDEAERLARGLEELREHVRAGSWRPGAEHEDVHMAVEAWLTEKLGALGGKLHTARSRNDQVATDVRLWLKRRLPGLAGSAGRLVAVLLDRVERDGRTLIPGYTHLQRGQPVPLGHHLLAHAWALSRDRRRIADALERLDRCPLGACAMAGTPHPIDRRRTAERLGFAGPVENAMDAVSARDHELEVVACCAIVMTHLSRMAEELVLWSSSEFGFVTIADAYATGSSIMPQKRNPDAAELIRGRAAIVSGLLQGMLSLVKGLPLSYNRDLQETRAPLFDAVESTAAALDVMAGMWSSLELRRDRFDAELADDPSLATELADALVEQGVPFREAHEIVGRLVRWCDEQGVALPQVPPQHSARFHPALPDGIRERLDPGAAAERRTSHGGTAWSEIERQLALLRATLD